MMKMTKMIFLALLSIRIIGDLEARSISTMRYEQNDNTGTKEHDYWNSIVKVCGSDLADLIAEICNHKYNEGGQESYIKFKYNEGIATECCMNWCPLSNIKLYCMDQ